MPNTKIQEGNSLFLLEGAVVAFAIGYSLDSQPLFFLLLFVIPAISSIHILRLPIAVIMSLLWSVALSGKFLQICLNANGNPWKVIPFTILMALIIFNLSLTKRVGISLADVAFISFYRFSHLFDRKSSSKPRNKGTSEQTSSNRGDGSNRERNSASESHTNSRKESGQSSNENPPQSNEKENFDPYLVLSIQHGASHSDITRAYRSLVKLYHPDKIATLAPEFQELAHQKMININRAYSMLTS